MDGKGRALDNIFVERFFRTLKYEDIYLNEYVTHSQERSAAVTSASIMRSGCTNPLITTGRQIIPEAPKWTRWHLDRGGTISLFFSKSLS